MANRRPTKPVRFPHHILIDCVKMFDSMTFCFQKIVEIGKYLQTLLNDSRKTDFQENYRFSNLIWVCFNPCSHLQWNTFSSSSAKCLFRQPKKDLPASWQPWSGLFDGLSDWLSVCFDLVVLSCLFSWFIIPIMKCCIKIVFFDYFSIISFIYFVLLLWAKWKAVCTHNFSENIAGLSFLLKLLNFVFLFHSLPEFLCGLTRLHHKYGTTSLINIVCLPLIVMTLASYKDSS